MPKVIQTPLNINLPYNKRHKGGPGVYDGEPGYPPRTKSSMGPPEKVRDEPPAFKGKGN